MTFATAITENGNRIYNRTKGGAALWDYEGNSLSMRKLIIITGQTASGKSTFASFLRKGGFPVCEFSSFFAHVLGSYSTSSSERLHAVVQYIASVGRSVYIDQLLAWTAHLSNDKLPLVLVGARHTSDINLLCHRTCVLNVIGVLATQENRDQRIFSRDKVLNSRLKLSTLPDPQVEKCLDQSATIHIDNNGSLDELASNAHALTSRFFSLTSVTKE